MTTPGFYNYGNFITTGAGHACMHAWNSCMLTAAAGTDYTLEVGFFIRNIFLIQLYDNFKSSIKFILYSDTGSLDPPIRAHP